MDAICRKINSDISLDDASLISYSYEEQRQKLKVVLKAWDDLELTIIFEKVVYFSYESGGIIAGIFQVDNSVFIDEVLRREFIKIPIDHTYKLINILDINDFPIIQVVCNEIHIAKVTCE